MESNLIVDNFGPITHVDMHLKNVNVFIGPQASGKSALAKLFTIFKAPRKFLKGKHGEIIELLNNFEPTLKDVLDEYNISSFLKSDSEISFDSALHKVHYKNGTIKYEPKLLNRINKLETLAINFKDNKDIIVEEIETLRKEYIRFQLELLFSSDVDFEKLDNLQIEGLNDIITRLKNTESFLSTNAALYIPAERNFIHIIMKAALNLQLNNVPIPKHILAFGAEIEKIDLEEIDLSFLQTNLKYKNVEGEHRIFVDEETSIKLSESASGIQSVMPIIMPILANNKGWFNKHKSFIIEEPELNLFPKAQYELIKLIEKERTDPESEDSGSTHTYTTHSPYVLSSLNNLLFAFKVKHKIRKEPSNFLEKIIPKNPVSHILNVDIDPSKFTAYQISNGGAASIFDEEAGLIKENFIDDTSDDMNDDFEKLMQLLEDAKRVE